MTLILFRHGIAMDRMEFAKNNSNDDLRPLTDRGRYRMLKAAKGLRNLVPSIDFIATSSLLRAKQTGEYLIEQYPEARTSEIDLIRPESSPKEFLPWLKSLDLEDDDTVCIVGHEPNISFLASYLLTGEDASFLQFKKAGACAIEFYSELNIGHCQLKWHLMPKHLRKLASNSES